MKDTVFKASGVSATKARQMYGLEDMSRHVNRVEQAIHEFQEISQTINMIADIQDTALFSSFGI